MNIQSKDLITAFQLKHPQSRIPLNKWVRIIESRDWRHVAELKESFRSVDYVDGYLIFDIKGNEVRLVAVVVFQNQQLVVMHVFTHSEYDRWSKKFLKRK